MVAIGIVVQLQGQDREGQEERKRFSLVRDSLVAPPPEIEGYGIIRDSGKMLLRTHTGGRGHILPLF